MKKIYDCTVLNKKIFIFTWRFTKFISIFMLLNLLIPKINAYATETGDERKYAHGLSYIYNHVNGKSFLIWSDNYNERTEKEAWEHDIYYKEITSNINENDINAGKKALIKADEAQEPASVSVAGDGKIIVTFEDGNDAGDNELAQRYAVYDENMQVIKEYPQTVALGGHSGHASSTENRHVVFWSEGWINGGGINNLGSGDDVWVTALSTNGDILSKKKVAVGEESRDWWPITASSKRKSLLIWQRYVDDEKYAKLCIAVYDPIKNDFIGKNGKKTKHTKPHVIKVSKTVYYNYNAVWSEELKVFVVNYTDFSGNGRILLIDENGKIKKTAGKSGNLPSFVREATPVYKESGKKVTLIYPSSENEYFFVYIKKKINKSSGKEYFNFEISEENKAIDWSYRGTAGFCTSDGRCFFAYLGKDGVKLKETGK